MVDGRASRLTDATLDGAHNRGQTVKRSVRPIEGMMTHISPFKISSL